jgi:hypothetical protein
MEISARTSTSSEGDVDESCSCCRAHACRNLDHTLCRDFRLTARPLGHQVLWGLGGGVGARAPEQSRAGRRKSHDDGSIQEWHLTDFEYSFTIEGNIQADITPHEK